MDRVEGDGSTTMFNATTPPSSLPVSSSSIFMIHVDCNSPVNPCSLKAGWWDKGQRQATFPTLGDLQKNLSNTFIRLIELDLAEWLQGRLWSRFFFFFIGLGL